MLLVMVPALAQRAPERLVRDFYFDWQRQQGQMEQFVRVHRGEFAEPLGDLLRRASRLGPQHKDSAFVDFDPFCGGSVMFAGFETGRAQIDGDGATVPVFVRLQLRPSQPGEVEGRLVRLKRSQGRWLILRRILEFARTHKR